MSKEICNGKGIASNLHKGFYGNLKTKKFKKIKINLFAQRLSKKLDFDYVLVPPTRGSFGDRVPGLNNTWDGLVGDLVTGVKALNYFCVFNYSLIRTFLS